MTIEIEPSSNLVTMQAMEIEGLAPPNGPAFIKTETRTGPPLNYVAEKLRDCVECLHSLYSAASQQRTCDEPKEDDLLGHCYDAFRSALVSYLALNNLLAIVNETDICDRLFQMNEEQFEQWLDGIEREGSVT